MVQDEKDGEGGKVVTVLPASAAKVISLVTRSSSLYLQVGTFIGGLAISGARITTLTGLELSRALLEAILHRAGRDVSERSIGELGRVEAEGVLERSIATLHSTITNISFAASTGFYLSSTVLSSAGDFSQYLLVFLDSIFGSTDSSKAIASIVTLVRREFQNPATGQEGEKIGVGDLFVGLCGMALLQRWCKKIIDAESKEGIYEEVVWDVVVLNDGRRADVAADNADSNQKSIARAAMSFVTPGSRDVVKTIERERRLSEDSDDDLPEMNLKRKIMKSLTADSSVSITTETTSTKTITVDISGPWLSDLMSPPPGIEIIEKNELKEDSRHGDGMAEGRLTGDSIPKHRVVYRVTHHKTRGTNIALMGSGDNAEEAIDLSSDEEDSPAIVQHKMNCATDLPSSNNASVVEKEPPKEISPKNRNATTASIKSLDSSQSPEVIVSKTVGRSNLPLLKGSENVANQKRSRKPPGLLSLPANAVEPSATKKALLNKPTPLSKAKPERPTPRVSEKKGSFRSAIRKGSSNALSHMWSKETSTDTSTAKSASKPAWGVSSSKSQIPGPQRSSSTSLLREAPQPPQRGNPNYFSSRDLGLTQAVDRSQSRTSYYSVHEQRRDSIVSQTDTYTIQSADTRPGSPTAFRNQLKAQSDFLLARSENSMLNQPGSPTEQHRKSHGYVPSVYTLKADSAQSLALVNPRGSAFEDPQTLESLMHTGLIRGMFPQHHIVRNISRFVRFSSASYGSHFLRVMGIASPQSSSMREINTNHHHEHHSFSSHTQLPPDTILLSSFIDPQGGTDSTGQTDTGVPMVHFISLDHESRAVVLTCRGTLGFEDVLTDMTCDYDELTYCGKGYNVHKGIHASARRLLDGGGRVMATIAAALEEFPDYGLVLCGHSLGGGVVSLLAILISEPSTDPASTAFFTSSKPSSTQLLLTFSTSEKSTAPYRMFLPAGRPIHVYAYGPPASVSPSLRFATRGLITTIVNGQDLVPFLSLGVLHDFQSVALAFKTDDSGAKNEFRKRVIAGITGTFKDKWYANADPGLGGADTDEDQWAYSALKVLRASMLSTKLLPPGEVFIVETMPVLQRDAFVRHDGDGDGESNGRSLGRPASRSILKYVRDVEKRFSEVRFGGSMLLDHSPGRYERSLGALAKGVLT